MAQERPRWPSWSPDGANMERQGRAKTAKLEPRWLQDGPRDRQDGQVAAKREPTWLQDGPRCAKMEPRERQDGAKMAKSEPKWSQHGSKMPKMRQHGPTLCLSRKSFIFLGFLLVLEAQREPQVAQERAKVGPRQPSWSQDGSKMAQESAKMAKLEPRRSQHGSKMAQDAPTWAGIGAQHGLRLRITAPVHRISPSGGGPGSVGKPCRRG